MFHFISDDRTVEYSYDFRSLCTPDVDNTFVSGTTTVIYNIGAPHRPPPRLGSATSRGGRVPTQAPPTPPSPRWRAGGNVTFDCNPEWVHAISSGTVIQVWGDAPAAPCEILDPEKRRFVPCTAECEVLGHTRPEFDLLDISNPATGGVRLRHTSLPSQINDRCGGAPVRPPLSADTTHTRLPPAAVPRQVYVPH